MKSQRTEVWYQPGTNQTGAWTGPRYRLIYQDEYGNWKMACYYYTFPEASPCIADNEFLGSFSPVSSKKELVEKMKKYDSELGFLKAVKLGDFL